MADTIDVTLRVRDEATGPVVAGLGQVRQSMDGVKASADALSDSSDSSRGLGRHFTALATSVGTQLNPALAQSAGFMSILAREGDRVSLGLTTFAVSAAIAVGALVEFNKVATEAATRHTELGRAVAGSDLSLATAQLTKAITDLRTQSELLSVEPIRRFSGEISTFLEKYGITSGGFLASLFRTDVQQKAASEAQAAFRQVFPEDVLQRMLKGSQDVAAATFALSHVSLQSAQDTLDLNLAYDAQGRALDALKDKQRAETAALLEKQTAERGALGFNFPGGVPADVQQGLDRAQGAERTALAAKQTAETFSVEKSLGDTLNGIEVTRLSAIRDIVRLQGDYVLSQKEGITLGESALGSLDQLIAKAKSRGASEKEVLELLQLQAQEIAKQQERVRLQGDIDQARLQHSAVGVDKATADRVALQAEELKRQSALAEAALVQNATDRQLQADRANAQADAQIAQLRYAQATENDPRTGLLAGFQQAADQAGQMGTMLKTWATSTAADMTTAFSSGFFDIFTGNLKDLPNVGKQFANAMVREISNALAQIAVAPVLSSIRNLLGGTAMGAMVLNPTVPPPFTVLGGGSGGSQVVIGQTGNLISAADAQTFVQQRGADAFLTVTGRPAPAGGEFSGISQQVLSPSPSLFSRVLPVAGSAAALGLSAFSASQNTSTPGIFASAALGGLSGAALGSSVASAFPALGLSSGEAGLGGAVIGAGLNAALALNAKNQADAAAAKQRQLDEVNRATAGGGALVSAAGGARDLVDLFNIITQHGSGTSGGSSAIAVPVTVQTPTGPKTIGQPNAAFPVASVQDLLANPGSLQANIQAGVAPSALTGANAATSTALQAIATGLANQFKTSEQGIRVSSRGTLPGGLQRTTNVPATLADTLQGPLSIEAPGFANLSGNDRALLLQALYAENQKRDLGFLVRDPSTNGIVSVTLMVPQTLPAPGALPQSPTGSTSAGAAGASTAELLTAGGALSLGLAVSLADPNSLLNKILPTGLTGPDLGSAIKNLVTTGSLSGAAGAVTVQDLVNQGEGLATVFNDAGASTAPGLGLGTVFDVAGGLSGILGLVQGAQTGDPLSILSSVASLYSSIAGIANSALGSTIPTISSLVSDAVGAVASTAAGGGAAGAEAASAAVAAIAPALAVAAPLIMAAILYATQVTRGDLTSWAVIGPLATAMQTAAAQSLAQASAVFATINAQHITDPTILKQAIQLGSQALLAYNRKAQGPAGPVGVSDFYARTGQDPTPLQNQAAAVQAGILKAIAVLEQGGATAADLANLAPAEWGDASLAGSRRGFFFTPAQANTAAGQTLALIGGPESLQPIMAQIGEGDSVIGYKTVGGVQGGAEALGQFAPDRATLAGENQQFPADTTNLEFGGPLWAMLAYLLGPTDQYESGGGNYYQTLASQGIAAPTFTPAQIPDWLAQLIAAAAAERQSMFLTGGGAGTPGGDSPSPGGEGAGTGPGGGAGP